MSVKHPIEVYIFELIMCKFAIHIEKPIRDCLYNSYKDGDVCRGMLYFIKSSTERMHYQGNACTYNDTSFTILI